MELPLSRMVVLVIFLTNYTTGIFTNQ